MLSRRIPFSQAYRSEDPPCAGGAPPGVPPSASPAPAARGRRRAKKPFTRRASGDAQSLRRTIQTAFLLLNLWIGAAFFLFVRHHETGGATPPVARPPGVEGWLPIAALMNLKYTVLTASLPETHVAGLLLLVAFLAMSWLLRKAFCAWLCPVGTISEWLWLGGDALFGRTWLPPRWIDVPLRGLKYLLFGLFAYAVASMSASDIRAFLDSPYGVIADVKMLNFFRHLGQTAAAVIGVLLLLSVVVKNVWCRYLCPYGALLGLVALASPVAIRRNAEACIDCAKCAKACPAALPVDRLARVASAECTSCLLCVTACPAAGALDLVAGRRRGVQPWAVAAGIGLVFFGLVGYGYASGRWHAQAPDAVYRELIPRAGEFSHP
jgi:polyferredoxin